MLVWRTGMVQSFYILRLSRCARAMRTIMASLEVMAAVVVYLTAGTHVS